MSLLRRVIGGVLRRLRQSQGRTLREVAAAAGVSVPYLSEVERGRKEASSEVLAAICRALGIRLSDLLEEARDDLRRVEPRIPSTPRATLTHRERVEATHRATAQRTLRTNRPIMERGHGATGPTLRVGTTASAGGSRPGPRTTGLMACARARAGARAVTVA
ncbi:helix-turn-helix transcriptional regulator [Micromonospora sp. NPDC005298]|uniref:helix-turn-helix domain-containing protein n=1 Tax=Micromonospora sp. NPDC005298 TaxID=3156873 RepID=UPI0033A93542